MKLNPFSKIKSGWTKSQLLTAATIALLILVPIATCTLPGNFSTESMQGNARKAITDPKFETEPGYCSRFVRQVTEAEYKQKYEDLFGSSAKVSANLFLANGWAFPASQLAAHGGLHEGDILFKRDNAGEFGHVGIYVGSNLVAENSSTKLGRVQGAKGYRTLKQFGRYDFVGHLPGNNGPRLILALSKANSALYITIPGAEFDKSKGTWIIDRDVVASALDEKAFAGRMPLREVVNTLHFGIASTGDHSADASDPRFYVFLKAA